MGFYLLHESMLQSVLVARDRWLRPGGLMMPSRAHIHAAPVSLHAFRRSTIDFWDDVHGFNLTALKPRAWDSAMASPLVRAHGLSPHTSWSPGATLYARSYFPITRCRRGQLDLLFT